MMYTKEQNEEIKKVITIFNDYIQKSPFFDVVWSEKLGYVYLNGISDDSDEVCMAPTILRDGRTLCDEILYHMACDIMSESGKPLDLASCSEEDKRAVESRLEPFMARLPEYRDLISELFHE